VLSVQPTDLLGAWSLDRRVVDHASGAAGQVHGALELAAAGRDVRWLERGILTWQGRELTVTRELRIVPDRDGWMVRFADGREFHPWCPGQPVRHQCQADAYCGLLVVDTDRSRIRVCWTVIGPAKRQRLVTRCRRLASDR
jgi:Family of unknown function (DUF6314)